jgi:glycosyltransferase involved in cell wall biosynthesis
MSTLRPGITVCIPSIPPRKALLERALRSVLAQTMPAAAVSVAVDLNREGAAKTRQRALDAVQTRWVAFLDDDDELLPNHLAALFRATENGAQYLWSRFRTAVPMYSKPGVVAGYVERDGPAPLGQGTFEQWNDEQPAQTTITTLVRTELARDVGGFTPFRPQPVCLCDSPDVLTHQGDCGAGLIDGQRAGEDWDFTLRCRAAAGLSGMRHVPEVTWTWHHHQHGGVGNTSGLPSRW